MFDPNFKSIAKSKLKHYRMSPEFVGTCEYVLSECVRISKELNCRNLLKTEIKIEADGKDGVFYVFRVKIGDYDIFAVSKDVRVKSTLGIVDCTNHDEITEYIYTRIESIMAIKESQKIAAKDNRISFFKENFPQILLIFIMLSAIIFLFIATWSADPRHNVELPHGITHGNIKQPK